MCRRVHACLREPTGNPLQPTRRLARIPEILWGKKCGFFLTFKSPYFWTQNCISTELANFILFALVPGGFGVAWLGLLFGWPRRLFGRFSGALRSAAGDGHLAEGRSARSARSSSKAKTQGKLFSGKCRYARYARYAREEIA